MIGRCQSIHHGVHLPAALLCYLFTCSLCGIQVLLNVVPVLFSGQRDVVRGTEFERFDPFEVRFAVSSNHRSQACLSTGRTWSRWTETYSVPELSLEIRGRSVQAMNVTGTSAWNSFAAEDSNRPARTNSNPLGPSSRPRQASSLPSMDVRRRSGPTTNTRRVLIPVGNSTGGGAGASAHSFTVWVARVISGANTRSASTTGMGSVSFDSIDRLSDSVWSVSTPVQPNVSSGCPTRANPLLLVSLPYGIRSRGPCQLLP